MKIRRVGAELFHTDGQTEVAKLIIPSRNFANAPKNCSLVKKETSVSRTTKSDRK